MREAQRAKGAMQTNFGGDQEGLSGGETSTSRPEEWIGVSQRKWLGKGLSMFQIEGICKGLEVRESLAHLES